MLKPVEGADRRVRVDPDGTLHLPAGCELLTNLYANHGVRVRLVRRPPPAPPRKEKIPTVRQLIDHLAKKQHLLLPPSDSDLASKSSSSTPTVPLLASQGVYGSGDGAGSSSHPRGSQEVVGGDVGGWDPRTNDLQKLKELELHGNSTRPLSRNGSSRREKVPFSRCQEEISALVVPSVTGSKPPVLRANGIKKDLLRTDHILAQNNHGVAGPEEDPVAMGTLWSPNHQRQTRSTSNTNTITTTSSSSTSSSNKSLPISISNGSGSGGSSALISGSGTLPAPRRPVGGSTSTTCQPLQQSAPWAAPPAMGNIVKSNKEVDPKYSDPVPGAAPSFQQRLMELAALEAETVRWERSKKVKKKPLRQDKDS